MVRRPSPELVELLNQYVPVRVTDLRGVDLARMRFDWDLTFAVVLMSPDGTIHHRYGGRDERGPSVWISQPSLEHVLRVGLETHDEYLRDPHPPVPAASLHLEDVPAFAVKDKGQCIHCHSVYPALFEEERAAGTFRRDHIWVYPPPGRVGVDLDRDDPQRIISVTSGSPADRAGLRAGDRILSLEGKRVASASDWMAVLDGQPWGNGMLHVQLERGEVVMKLGPGWREGTPLELSWRPLKWALRPAPGFGGPQLPPDELHLLGLAEDLFAFRVAYFVTWGENAGDGRAAQRAGMLEGDIVLGADGVYDFQTVDHFHAWWRLTRSEGEEVPVMVWREGKRLELHIR